MGVSTSLTWYDFGALLTLIQSIGARFILEIGVEHGGATAMLSSYCFYSGAVYRGIDISLASLAPAVRDLDGDTLIERDAWADTTVDEVRRWLANHVGPALIFVDGGDKPKELRLYAPLIRPGDMIVAHDYHNEYGDEALWGMPNTVERIVSDWLDDTLLCAFRGIHVA